MKAFGEILLLFLLFPTLGKAILLTPKLEDKGVLSDSNHKFMDPKVDYSRFGGRVSDKDDAGNILKIKVENNNAKFFKAGDLVQFKVNNHDRGRFCIGSVRTIEDFYFSIYVQDFSPCWDTSTYFPRGLQLNFLARRLEQRVFEASKYREILILRKEDFLKQLNEINHFLWSYDQKRLQAAADYDAKINALKREKQLALDNLIQKKQENITLQSELIKNLDSLDGELEHYRIERQELLMDRWAMDHEQDLPVLRRPQKIKAP